MHAHQMLVILTRGDHHALEHMRCEPDWIITPAPAWLSLTRDRFDAAVVERPTAAP